METERLLLRHWQDTDAADLYEYAKDPDIGPIAGWPAHTSVENSLDIIRGILGKPETYAICLKETGRPVGSISLHRTPDTNMTSRTDECELGYWLGKPHWGHGIATEAAREMLRHAFEDLGMQAVWARHYDGNTGSRRVLEKCGFRHQWTEDEAYIPLLQEPRASHIFKITQGEWHDAASEE